MNGGIFSALALPRERQYIHGSSLVGFSGVLFGVMAHTDGAAGFTTTSSTTQVTSSPLILYVAPLTTLVPHDSATDTSALNPSAVLEAAHMPVTISTCSPRSPHPTALSTSLTPTKRDLAATGLKRVSDGLSCVIPSTVRSDLTPLSGASKNSAPTIASPRTVAAR